MRAKLTLTLLLALVPQVAGAEVLCDRSGEAPSPPDTALTARIASWTARTQGNLKMRVPATKSDALSLQSSVAQWADQAPLGSVDYFFRQAIGHGVNAQYERLMIDLRDGDAEKHTYFMHLEAARADACLSVLSVR